MFSKFIPDFSTRKEYKQPPPTAPAPSAPQIPRASEYLPVPPPLPVKSVIQISSIYTKKERTVRHENLTTPMTLRTLDSDPQQYNTGYAPNIATTPTLGSSYFATYQDVVANGGATWSKFPALQNIDISGFNISSIGSMNASGASFSTISTAYAYMSTMDAKVGDISSLTTRIIDLDGNLLTTDNGGGGELLLNGIPIATVANLSNIADWSIYDAISTVQMEGQDINRLGILKFDSVNGQITGLSTINGAQYPNPNADASLWANFPAVSSINANNNNLLNVSTLYATDGNITNILNASTLQTNLISTSQVEALNGTFQNNLNVSTMLVSTINNFAYPPPNSDVSQWANFPAVAKVDVNDLDLNNVSSVVFVGGANKLTTNPSNQLTYNGTVVTTGDNASQWSRYAALQTVSMNAQTLNDTRAITGNGANLDIDVTGITGQTSVLNLKAENGLQGQVNITAGSGDLNNGGGLVNIRAEGGAPAISGLYGHINLTATYGQVGFVSPTYTGGLIELNATSGPGVGATSAIKFSAAGINSYAGAIPSIGSLAGYNFVYGTSGINLVAGLIPPIIPAFPTCVYLYGSAGIQLDSDTYVTNIYPYWSLGTLPAPNLKLSGRTIGVYKSFVDVQMASQISFDPDGNKQLLGAEVITLTDAAQITISTTTGTAGQVLGKDAGNALRWIDVPGTPLSPDLLVSTLTTAATGYVSTPQLFVSTINGLPFTPGVTPTSITNGGATVACTTGGNITLNTPDVTHIESMIGIATGNVEFRTLNTTVGLYNDSIASKIEIQATGNMYIDNTGGADVVISAGTSPFNQILLNNLAISQAGDVVTFPLGAGATVIGQLNNISTINGSPYVPGTPLSPDLLVSTLTTAATGYISTPTAYVSSIVGLSSINGQSYPPAVSAGSFITLGGASVACTSLGEINAISASGQDINLNSGNNLRLNSAGGLANAIFMNGGLTVDYTGSVLEFAPQPGTAIIQGQIVGVSTINAQPYPPPFSGSISSITNGTGFVDVTPAGAINVSAASGQLIDITTDDILVLNGLSQVTINSGVTVDSTGHKLTFDLGAGSAVVGQISNVSTINGQTPGLIWEAGGTYSDPNVTVPANTNTLISYQSITTFSTTAKYLIMVQFTATEVAVGNIYATLGRSALVPTAANTTNLSDRASALTNSIAGNGLHMWVESSSSAFTTIICHAVDNPGSIGTFYYSLWIRSAPGITNLATELGTVTVLQVAP